MGFIKTALGISLGVVAVSTAKEAIQSRDGDTFLACAITAGLAGSGAYRLLKSEVESDRNKMISCGSQESQKLIES